MNDIDLLDEAAVIDAAKKMPEEEAFLLLKQHGFRTTKGRMSEWMVDFVSRHEEFRPMFDKYLKLIGKG